MTLLKESGGERQNLNFFKKTGLQVPASPTQHYGSCYPMGNMSQHCKEAGIKNEANRIASWRSITNEI